MSVRYFWLCFREGTAQTGPFSSCSAAIPCEKPYNDLLKCLEDGFACIFNLLSIILKLRELVGNWLALFFDRKSDLFVGLTYGLTWFSSRDKEVISFFVVVMPVIRGIRRNRGHYLISPETTPINDCDTCIACDRPIVNDYLECVWCERHQRRSCARISVDQFPALCDLPKNIVFFCCECINKLPTALITYRVW